MMKEVILKNAYHLMALVSVLIWGTTFASTKVLLEVGLSPADIMFYRFLMAYGVMFIFKPKFMFAGTLKDELLFVAAGISGGSLYFFTENTALDLTLVSNVGIIVGTAPILTVLLSKIWLKNETVKKTLVWGSVVALIGLVLVIYNGRFILKLNLLGDILAFIAALTWAFYNIVLKWLDGRYSIYLITRKVFFYGVVTLLPVFYFEPLTVDTAILFSPKVFTNLLFLGLAASLLCFVMWNKSVKHLGTIATSNYIYFVPVVALLTSAVILHEHITVMAMSGSALILGGVWLAENGDKIKTLIKK